MEKNGWSFGGHRWASKNPYYDKQCNSDTWYGYRIGSKKPASVSATFEGYGTATLTFGNCHSTRTVDVYFNDVPLSTAIANELRKTVTFNFFKGSQLRIEVNGAIIKLNSLEILCGGKS